MITVEGIGSASNPHPAQERIALFHGSQCGFCTPGIVMSLYALLRNTDGHPTEDQIAESFDGNLCRCTGYKPIIDAANTFSCGRPGGCCRDKKTNSVANESVNVTVENGCGKTESTGTNENEVDMNKLFSPNGLPLKPYKASIELTFPSSLKNYELKPLYFGNEKKVWFRPVTKNQLLQIKHAYPESKLVGGASEIQIEIKMKAMNYNVSVFANDIEEMKFIRYIPNKGLEFGSNISLSRLEYFIHDLVKQLGPEKSQVYTAMAEQLKYFAGRQIRNAATPAGNIATASPISDLNPVLVAAEAVLTVESIQGGVEELSMTDFFVSYRKTKLPSHGVITKIFVPETQAKNEIVRAYKQAKRKDDDIAIVTACIRLAIDDDHRITKARLVYGGVGPLTLAAKKTADALVGLQITASTSSKILETAIDGLSREFELPYGVPGGMATYRRTLILSFFYKFYNTVLQSLPEQYDNLDVHALAEVSRTTKYVGKRDLNSKFEQTVVGKSNPHLSALKQVTGEAIYIDDIAPFHREVFGVQVMSTKARAKILSIDTSQALEIEGVVGYVDINDLSDKKANIWHGIPTGDELFFADGEVHYVGQCIGLVLAADREIAAEGARAVKVEYEEMESILTIEQAIEKESYFNCYPRIDKGNIEEAFKNSEHVFEGTTRIGSQEHFYFETQGSIVIPEEGDEYTIYSSSQNPQETQILAAQVVGVPQSKVVARVKRLGGGFGGKETRACQVSSVAAVAAKKYKRPVRMILSRSEDMLTSGQRHPFGSKWKVGLDKYHKFTAIDVKFYANAGWTMDLTKGVVERACFHVDNGYHFPNAQIQGFCCKTNVASNTAFRGFGGPQGMFTAESYIYEISEKLGIDADVLREINYYEPGKGQSTPYQQAINDDYTLRDLAKNKQTGS